MGGLRVPDLEEVGGLDEAYWDVLPAWAEPTSSTPSMGATLSLRSGD